MVNVYIIKDLSNSYKALSFQDNSITVFDGKALFKQELPNLADVTTTSETVKTPDEQEHDLHMIYKTDIDIKLEMLDKTIKIRQLRNYTFVSINQKYCFALSCKGYLFMFNGEVCIYVETTLSQNRGLSYMLFTFNNYQQMINLRQNMSMVSKPLLDLSANFQFNTDDRYWGVF